MAGQRKRPAARRSSVHVSDPVTLGREALKRCEWEAARDLFLEAAKTCDAPAVLEHLGWAYYWLDDAEHLFDVRERAYRAYYERGDRRAAARVAMWLACDYAEFRGDRAVANGLLERAKEWLDGFEPSPEHAWLIALTAHEVLLGDKDPARAVAAATKGIQIAQIADAAEVAVVLEALVGLANVTQGRIEEGMRRLDAAAVAALGGAIDDRPAIGTVCCYIIHACERAQDYDRGVQWCERLKDLTTRWGYRPMLGSCRMQYAGVLICRGEWQAAEAELTAGSELLARVRPAMSRNALPRLAELRRRQGRWEEATELFRRIDHTPLGQLGLAELSYDQGDAATAADLAERYLHRFAVDDRLERAPALELLARSRIALDDETGGAAALAELEQIACEVATPALKASARHAAGVLRFARGDFDEARRSFEDAVDLYARSGSPFETGRARLELARTFDALGRPAPARAEALIARQSLADLGATRLVERIDTFVAGLTREQKPAANDDRGAPLSSREVEVLRLVAQGFNDRDIASRLFLSPHTVHRHISNILLKTHQPTRAARSPGRRGSRWSDPLACSGHFGLPRKDGRSGGSVADHAAPHSLPERGHLSRREEVS
jgi:ATP/maltotriose-dependent transcriptional regulator MalT